MGGRTPEFRDRSQGGFFAAGRLAALNDATGRIAVYSTSVANGFADQAGNTQYLALDLRHCPLRWREVRL